MPDRILIVDDSRSMRDLLSEDLGRRGFEPIECATAQKASELVLSGSVDVVITDLRMPGADGIELCGHLHANMPDVPVIVLTAFGSLETAIAAIRAGAYDFVTKPVELEVLAFAVSRAAQHRRLQAEVTRLSDAIEIARPFGALLGSSTVMDALFSRLRRVAGATVPVLILGESGVGKELVARSIHSEGQRANAPFVTVDCAALSETLLESELFGHRPGAFTGALGTRTGLFVSASGGTVFLDEIGELPLSLQPKLLRALEERVVRPLGADREVPVDVAVIAATHRDLESAVEAGEFRADLFYRLKVIEVCVPPLRARGNDILMLAQRFLEDCATRLSKPVRGLSRAAAEKL
ncbi:MAG: sigma-54-dependent Fis family transcriptional regulator, partial [Planctomycetes bacterium]|nr:sigma-54-dependent Fis family transcriptional regulator [Planctomycetota bacterium]